MIRILGNIFSKIARRYLPDAFVFAILLTLIIFILGMTVQKASFVEMSFYFGKGMWDFLAFAMQMVLILVTGSALATSKPVYRSLKNMVKIAKTPSQAVIFTTVTMIIGCWLNWGFGLIVSALVARELAKTIKGVHYPLLVASAYSGFLVWHAGFSASIPLKIAGPDKIMEQFGNDVIIPVSETIFAWQNLLLVFVFFITIPFINKLMHPKKKEDIIEADPMLFEEEEETHKDKDNSPMNKKTPASRVENSWVLTLALGIIGITYLIYHFLKGGNISLNIVIMIFLTLGLLFHKTPISYVRAITTATGSCGGIILQFPIYAGIMGMMIDSGLAVSFSHGFINMSNQTTFPLFTFLSAGLVNFFVPSGGGQWAVQGPIMMPAAYSLGVPYSVTAMAIAWGDAWTNLVQPFWALPLLAVAKLKIRDIMGYTAVILLYSGIIISLFMLFVF